MSATVFYVATALALGALETAEPGTPPIGSTVADFALTDHEGNTRRLSDWRNSPVVTLVFLGAGCPVAESYARPAAELAGTYGPRGVAFLGVAPNPRDSPAALARFAAAHGVRFPMLRDRGGAAAARLGVTRTPAVVVLDARRAIRYRGRIDDQYAVGARRAEPRRQDLAAALDELLAGRPVSRPETEAVGCPIERPVPTPAAPAVTYSRDVAPVLRRRRVGCHRPGQMGPFSLNTYRQAAGWAGAIAEVVEDGRMPPWHADPRHGRFRNDARLTDREKQLIAAWAAGGAAEGDPADLPAPAPAPGGWGIPAPDLVVSMPRAFTVPARGVIDYQSFEVNPGFKEDRWVRGAEVRPGNRKVVHHCTVFLKAPGGGDDVNTQGELGSYCLAATTPGTPPTVLPDGMARRIPAGWSLVFVVHYTPVGTAETDRTRLGLLFADPKTVRKEVATNLLADPDLRIPPHAPRHRVERARRFDQDVLLLAMFPHMHLRGRSFRYEAVFPDGRAEVLLDVPRYDFHWQNRYELAAPRRLPAGTVLRCVAHYDNSADNPSNPDPGAVVVAGKQNSDEMFNGYYDFTAADQDLTRPPTRWVAFLRAVCASWRSALPPAGLACAAACLLRLRRERARGRHSYSRTR